MTTEKQMMWEQQPTQVSKMKNSGAMSFIGTFGSPTLDNKNDEMSRSVLSSFGAKEEEIEKKEMAVRDHLEAQLGRIEEESKHLAEIQFVIDQELEALQDPMRKEVALLRKRIDTVNKELKPLGITCQKKEREYKELLDAFNEKSKEKALLVAKLIETVGESEKLRTKKLEELRKHIESLK
ncbi:uncharacterized protein LOC141632262 [Silene latifolia]|uniref:uncharacterized protein LOC141632262 n=1 Tax=Silene latifolia TaxID=37657 RepID=UPI003D76BF9A